jgi:DNA polymerase-3 subunit alpha
LLVAEDIPSPLLASDLKLNLYREVELVGYLVAYKTTYTQQGDKMCFGTFLDLHGHWLDTVHFPAATKDFPFRGPGVYHLKGRVEEEFDFFYLNVSFMRRLNSKNVG